MTKQSNPSLPTAKGRALEVSVSNTRKESSSSQESGRDSFPFWFKHQKSCDLCKGTGRLGDGKYNFCPCWCHGDY